MYVPWCGVYLHICSSCTCLSTSFTGTLPDVSITDTPSTDTSITVNIGTIPSGIERVIIGYHRMDLGVPVVGEYENNRYGIIKNILLTSIWC